MAHVEGRRATISSTLITVALLVRSPFFLATPDKHAVGTVDVHRNSGPLETVLHVYGTLSVNVPRHAVGILCLLVASKEGGPPILQKGLYTQLFKETATVSTTTSPTLTSVLVTIATPSIKWGKNGMPIMIKCYVFFRHH